MTTLEASTSRLEHLAQASDLLSSSSPTVAAYLRVVRDCDMSDAKKTRLEDGVDPYCQICGGILTLEDRAGVDAPRKSTAAKLKRTRKDRLAMQDVADKVLRLHFNCRRCHSTTTIESASPKTKQAKGKGKAPVAREPVVQKNPVSPAEAMDAKSDGPSVLPKTEFAIRKRPKSRRAGLLDMLAKKKSSGAASSSGANLDIMDFMKE